MPKILHYNLPTTHGVDINKSINDNLVYKLGICCLSTKLNNEYLWNYKKINHNGICLEYDANALRRFLRLKLKTQNSFHLFSGVLYLDVIEKVNYDIDTNSNALITILNWFFVKQVNPYSNEYEVRVVSNFDHYNNAHSFVTLPNELLKNVYLAKNVSNSDCESIRSIIVEKYKGRVGLIMH